jgi:hypothetical protein
VAAPGEADRRLVQAISKRKSESDNHTAALLCKVDHNAIWERILSGELQVSEMPAAGLLICLNSLEQPR